MNSDYAEMAHKIDNSIKVNIIAVRNQLLNGPRDHANYIIDNDLMLITNYVNILVRMVIRLTEGQN